MSSPNVYAAEPALPVLAHTLVSSNPIPHPQQDSNSHDAGQPSTLKVDIENAFQSGSRGVFRCGTVIGFSMLRNTDKGGNDQEYIGQIPRYILTKRLHHTLSSKSTPTPTPSTFIIYPISFSAFSPEKLLSSLLSHQPPLSRSSAITLLDSVQLIPVFDFATALQAISEVSESLHKHPQKENDTQTSPDSDPDPDPASLLVIAGLDTLAEGVIRASNAVRGAAVLTTALRTLTQLSRSYASSLAIVLVNTGGLGGGPAHAHAREEVDSHPSPTSTASGHDDNRNSSQGRYSRGDGIIDSIFRESGTPLLHNLLTKTLDQGIDSHLLLSTVKRRCVVEVIKDRVGDGRGRWCVWG